MTRSYRECGPVIKNRFLVSMLGGGSSSPWLKPGASRPRTGYEQCALTIAWFKKPRGMRPRCAWTRRVVLCGLLTLILHRGPSPSDRPDTMIPISSVTIPPGRDVCRLRGHVENGLAKNRPDDILCSEASPLWAGACHRSSPLKRGTLPRIASYLLTAFQFWASRQSGKDMARAPNGNLPAGASGAVDGSAG